MQTNGNKKNNNCNINIIIVDQKTVINFNSTILLSCDRHSLLANSKTIRTEELEKAARFPDEGWDGTCNSVGVLLRSAGKQYTAIQGVPMNTL